MGNRGKDAEMQVRQEQGYTIFDMEPYVAKDSVPHICQQLDPHIVQGAQYVLDMWEAKTLNSSMASVIVHIVKRAQALGSKLNIVNIAQSVLSALETLHLTDMAAIYETALDFEIEKGVELKSIMH